ncbi:hypothetical protein [Arthrobacter crystallopoietes]|uniref:Uncharacterized protein n=1 Tax=Crystallibacter crystallopoietes TaxID=37928 RepID=A0A1H1APQ9_9MICC|nr:hypothetical protein [Arthrobacter crystallopoietes]AUI51450.1 hypothetical protein AC20117_12200 [Arthrobacter crystallopoietes]SDQ41491.1 hypothetical protein SAMN04489742_1025 [Arthrobacter crystallopoietes]
MGNRLAKPAAVSARVLLAAGLGALGWTFFSTTTAAASDESAGLTAVETALQAAEKPAAELTDPAVAAVNAVVGQATPDPSGTPAPAAQPAPADLGVIQEVGAAVEDAAPVIEAPATEAVQPVVPAAETVVQELDATVEHLDAAVQDAGLPAVLPEQPLNTVTDAVVGQLDGAVDVVTAPIEVITAPVEQVLEPVTDELSPAVPILPESPAVPVTDSEPAPAEPTPAEPAAEPVPTQAEPASPVVETSPKKPSGSTGVEEAPDRTAGQEISFPSDGPEGSVGVAEAVDLQAQPPSMDIVQLPAPDAAAGISRATEVPSPTAGPIPVAAFPATSGGSSGGGGGGSAGHGSADAYLTGGKYQWVAAGLAHRAESVALPASPVFDPGSTPD